MISESVTHVCPRGARLGWPRSAAPACRPRSGSSPLQRAPLGCCNAAEQYHNVTFLYSKVSYGIECAEERGGEGNSQVPVGELAEVVGAHAVVRVGRQHGARVGAACQRVHAHAVPAVYDATLQHARYTLSYGSHLF